MNVAEKTTVDDVQDETTQDQENDQNEEVVEEEHDDSVDEQDQESETDAESEEIDYSAEAEYLKQKGFDAKNFDEFIEQQKAKIEELDQIKKLHGDKPAPKLDQTKGDQDKDKTGPLIGRSLVKSHIENLVASGAIPKEHEAGWKQTAQVLDAAITPMVEKTESLFADTLNIMLAMNSQLRDGEWVRLERRFGDVVKRDILDKMREQNPFLTYESVLKQMAVSDPKILAKFAEKSIPKDKRKPFGRFSKPTRDMAGQSGGAEFRKYLEGGELSDAKMNAAGLSPQKQVELAKKWLEYNKRNVS